MVKTLGDIVIERIVELDLAVFDLERVIVRMESQQYCTNKISGYLDLTKETLELNKLIRSKLWN